MFLKMLGVNLDHPVVDFTSKQPKISGKSCRERDWHRAVRRSERPPRSTKAEVINWWSADNFAFGLNNSCIVGTNIFVWMPSLCFTYKVVYHSPEVCWQRLFHRVWNICWPICNMKWGKKCNRSGMAELRILGGTIGDMFFTIFETFCCPCPLNCWLV